MKLNKKISITPPAYSDQNNKIINPAPIILEQLNVIYADDDFNNKYYAQIQSFPNPVLLYEKEEYIKNSPINKSQGEIKLKKILGESPEKYLRALFPRTMEEDPNGPGSVLSQMIKTLGIVMSQGCSCRRHAIEMNTRGNNWCENNIDTIIIWLKEEAKKRKLPFIDSVGKLMVNRAIKKSKMLLEHEKSLNKDQNNV